MATKIVCSFCAFLFTSTALACFNNAGCPTGNVCVKTGNLLGICISQAMPLTDATTGPATTNTATSTTVNPVTGTTTTTTVTPANPAAAGSTTNTPAPPMPVARPQAVGTTCTNDINCSAGFICARAAGNYYGICTQVAR